MKIKKTDKKTIIMGMGVILILLGLYGLNVFGGFFSASQTLNFQAIAPYGTVFELVLEPEGTIVDKWTFASENAQYVCNNEMYPECNEGFDVRWGTDYLQTENNYKPNASRTYSVICTPPIGYAPTKGEYSEISVGGVWGGECNFHALPSVCSINTDCGLPRSEGVCRDGDFYNDVTTYTCKSPGTSVSECIAKTNQNLVKHCTEGCSLTYGGCKEGNEIPPTQIPYYASIIGGILLIFYAQKK